MPTRQEYEEYLVVAYFGPTNDLLARCCDRAYRDFSRTLRGVGAFAKAKEAARAALLKRISSVKSKNPTDQVNFDSWHTETCAELCQLFKKNGYENFRVGHAQKWINMTFKYIFVLGNKRIDGYDHLYKFCHVPIDKVLITQSGIYPQVPWSQLDHSEYLEWQKEFRRRKTGAPLDDEFRLWLKGMNLQQNN